MKEKLMNSVVTSTTGAVGLLKSKADPFFNLGDIAVIVAIIGTVFMAYRSYAAGKKDEVQTELFRVQLEEERIKLDQLEKSQPKIIS